MAGRRNVSWVAALLALACASAPLLAGCQADGPTGQASGQTPTVQAAAPEAAESSGQTSAPSIASSVITLPSDMLLLLGIEDPKATLESLGCTDVVENEDGSFSAHVAPEVYGSIVNVYYQRITEFFDSLPQNEVYPRVVSCSYDESFATLVFVLDGDTLVQEDTALQEIAARAAMHYQKTANLPPACTVVLMSADGGELASTDFSEE